EDNAYGIPIGGFSKVYFELVAAIVPVTALKAARSTEDVRNAFSNRTSTNHSLTDLAVRPILFSKPRSTESSSIAFASSRLSILTSWYDGRNCSKAFFSFSDTSTAFTVGSS